VADPLSERLAAMAMVEKALGLRSAEGRVAVGGGAGLAAPQAAAVPGLSRLTLKAILLRRFDRSAFIRRPGWSDFLPHCVAILQAAGRIGRHSLPLARSDLRKGMAGPPVSEHAAIALGRAVIAQVAPTAAIRSLVGRGVRVDLRFERGEQGAHHHVKQEGARAVGQYVDDRAAT